MSCSPWWVPVLDIANTVFYILVLRIVVDSLILPIFIRVVINWDFVRLQNLVTTQIFRLGFSFSAMKRANLVELHLHGPSANKTSWVSENTICGWTWRVWFCLILPLSSVYQDSLSMSLLELQATVVITLIVQ